MSEARKTEILTREELDDLLSGQGAERRDRPDDRLAERLPRSRRTAPTPVRGNGELRRAVAECAAQWGRRMASSYQRRIECSLIGWDEVDVVDLLPVVLETDEIVCFSVGSETGFALMARPLFTALLSLEFGAGGAAKPTVAGPRAFTGIERRLLTRLVRDFLAVLEISWRPRFDLPARIADTCNRDRLVERVSSPVALATLDVTALDTVGRLRVGIPAASFRDTAGATPQEVARDGARKLEGGIVDVPVTLRAELGTVDLTLTQIANLRVGDVLSLQPSASDGLLIRVEGQPKFRAIAGRVGSRLAAQAVERLQARGDRHVRRD